jgi:hypothetical protein
MRILLDLIENFLLLKKYDDFCNLFLIKNDFKILSHLLLFNYYFVNTYSKLNKKLVDVINDKV